MVFGSIRPRLSRLNRLMHHALYFNSIELRNESMYAVRELAHSLSIRVSQELVEYFIITDSALTQTLRELIILRLNFFSSNHAKAVNENSPLVLLGWRTNGQS